MSDAKVGSALRRLRQLHDEAEDPAKVDLARWLERARLAIGSVYGDSSAQLERFDETRYTLGAWSDSTPRSAHHDARLRGISHARSKMEALIEDLEDRVGVDDVRRPGTTGDPRVFVVHGRDVALRETVARFLERLGLQPIVLHEQADNGRTIIEKFEDHALEAGAAVVLLTADDSAYGPEDPAPSRPNRARQNVILELGYFLGVLGRSKTIALYQPGVELPSDIHGLLYVPVDGDWQLKLARELRAAGMPVDMNRAL